MRHAGLKGCAGSCSRLGHPPRAGSWALSPELSLGVQDKRGSLDSPKLVCSSPLLRTPVQQGSARVTTAPDMRAAHPPAATSCVARVLSGPPLAEQRLLDAPAAGTSVSSSSPQPGAGPQRSLPRAADPAAPGANLPPAAAAANDAPRPRPRAQPSRASAQQASCRDPQPAAAAHQRDAHQAADPLQRQAPDCMPAGATRRAPPEGSALPGCGRDQPPGGAGPQWDIRHKLRGSLCGPCQDEGGHPSLPCYLVHCPVPGTWQSHRYMANCCRMSCAHPEHKACSAQRPWVALWLADNCTLWLGLISRCLRRGCGRGSEGRPW